MFSNGFHSVLKSFYSNTDELKFSSLFVSAITVNKYVLSELRFTVPTVFQGWQTFTCVALLTVLVKFHKTSEEVRMLDWRNFYFMLPGFVFFAAGIVAGSIGLSKLPLPVFCAILSLHPAILVLLDKNTSYIEDSKRVCGSAAICGTVVVTLVITLDHRNASNYMWLIGHVILTVMYSLYTAKLNMDLGDISKIYYRNLFSVIVLLPISIYLDVLSLPKDFNWKFYIGCILSGVLGTFLQLSTSKLETQSSFVNCQGRAKLICSVLAHHLFSDHVEPIVWVLILVNLLISSFVLSPDTKYFDSDKKSKLSFFVSPPHVRDLYSDKTICV